MPSFIKGVMHQGASCVQIFYVISAYLGCSYFYRPGASTLGYYKKRAFRILPLYYSAIVMAMVYVEVFRCGTTPDSMGLGWLRYFLGLNMLLPSNSFDDWNNCFGFWAMGCLLFFYVILPSLIKFVNCFSWSVVFFVICWVGSLFLLQIDTVDRFLIYWGPFNQLQYFALGIVAFYANREKKQSLAILMMLLFALLPNKTDECPLLFALLSGIAIMAIKDEDVMISRGGQKVLQFFSKYSFHIYLSHMLALSAASVVSGKYFADSALWLYGSRFILTVFLTVLLSVLLELSQRTIFRCISAFSK